MRLERTKDELEWMVPESRVLIIMTGTVTSNTPFKFFVIPVLHN